MKKILAAYWHKDKLDVYRYDKGKPALHASGIIDQLKPVRSRLHKMVLVVGRERLMHLCKRYPPAPFAKLTNAVNMEIKNLFPLSKPAFYCRVAKTYSTYTNMDIWAWESDQYENIKSVFPFHYVLPEDLAFDATDTRVTIYPFRDRINMTANANDRFLGAVSLPKARFDARDLSQFLLSLAQDDEEIKKLVIYGLPSFQPGGEFQHEIIRIPDSPVPPCIDRTYSLDLRSFKVGSDIGFMPGIDQMLVLRIVLYIVLGYALMLSLTWKNYDKAAAVLKGRTMEINKKLAAVDQTQPQKDYSPVIKEVKEKLKTGPLPLNVMTMLARRLPEGSFITRLVCNENNIDLTVSAKDPLAVLKALSVDKDIKKIGVKGAPSKASGTGVYNILMTLELK
ncbi:hypothetical protein [Desulfobacterium sp. N47]|uniref:GspL cytoplasmic actin-ATPase-like domain-containing protein n=1 Tax=uncultured Desulfobacterium sp. TaxID=201089 RepID=E1YBG5_9BACT|nr:hypothetical protein N47_G32330 [uncultured Desulfobacterium sp.]